MFSVKPRTGGARAAKGQAKRDREARRGRLNSAAARDIGPLPPVANPKRREATRLALRTFCETYLPKLFYMGWSSDHLRAIDRIERACLEGGLFALAMPRGNGKTTLTIAGIAWAMVHGHRRYACTVGASDDKARIIARNIKAILSENDLLAEDFPEVCAPIRALENESRRCRGQTIDGRHTCIEWSERVIVLPTVEGSASSGSILTFYGIMGSLRGQSRLMPDGRIARPDLVNIDDPQDAESAHSDEQCRKRLSIIQQDILGLAGPSRKIAGFMPCTVIRAGDLSDTILDRNRNPDWQGERCRMLDSMPENLALWDRYAEIRRESLQRGGTGAEATEFYRQHREEMDRGAKASWPERYNADEISAIQHAMNLRIRDGEAGFAAEYQNEPAVEAETPTLTPDRIMAKCNGFDRGRVPIEAQKVTAFVDVHADVLYWAVCGWSIERFDGWLIDYGTHPEQPQAEFLKRNATRTLTSMAGDGVDPDAAILRGLSDLVTRLLGAGWKTAAGAELRIDRLLIDAGWRPDIVGRAIAMQRAGETVMPSRGDGITAANVPISEYTRKPGELIGCEWIVSRPKSGEFRQVRFDANWWKTFIHERLGVELGGAGCLSLYGGAPARHRMLAAHLTAEFPISTEGRGRKLNEWRLRAHRPDNHFFDAVTGCAVAASTVGCGMATPRATPKPAPKRRRIQFRPMDGNR